jgi:LytS/YehU family sensor histidine kinase
MSRLSPRHIEWFESLVTRRLPIAALLVAVVPVALFAAVLALTGTAIEPASKFVDSAFKIVVTLVGAVCVLHRYFVGRTDACPCEEVGPGLTGLASVPRQPSDHEIV